MESGPEITPAEERVSDWWICTDLPGPTEVPTVPLLLEINVNKSSWHNYDEYRFAPARNNVLSPGTVVHSGGKAIGVIKEAEVKFFFSGAGIQHEYTVETTREWLGT